MTEKRFTLAYEIDNWWAVRDGEITLWKEEVISLLNEQDKTIKELEKENENQNNILEDFMLMLNRLQAEPNNRLLQMMSRDMLRLMGKNVMGDSE